MKLEGYLHTIEEPNHIAGGGSVAATNGALASSLILKACNMINKSKENTIKNDIFIRLSKVRENFIENILNDGQVYGEVIKAYSLPKTSESDKKIRLETIQAKLKNAAESPLNMLIDFVELDNLLNEVKVFSNTMSDSELDVAKNQIIAGYKSAKINIYINLDYIKDEEYIESSLRKILDLDKNLNIN